MGIVKSKKALFDNEQDFLDFLMQVRVEADADIVIIEKAVLPEEFFDLKSGFAGMVHQKLVNYRTRMAITGDFTGYDSKALDDYIRECNENNGDIVFLRSVNEAIGYFAG